MRYIVGIIILTLLAFHFTGRSAAADTRYVSDELIITLRQGKSTDYKIIKTLKSGTPLEVLEEDKPYLKVRTADGVEGYVLSQYITTRAPNSQRIEELEKQKDALEKKMQDLEQAKNRLETERNSLRETYDQELGTLTTKSSDLENSLEEALEGERIANEKYDTLLAQAENVVDIAAERDLLAQQKNKLTGEVAALNAKNEKMGDTRMIKWFLAGGGVFLFGWIIGKVSRKKRSRF